MLPLKNLARKGSTYGNTNSPRKTHSYHAYTVPRSFCEFYTRLIHEAIWAGAEQTKLHSCLFASHIIVTFVGQNQALDRIVAFVKTNFK